MAPNLPTVDHSAAAPVGAGSLLLGRYRVVELKDQGGFGNVLVCWDVRLQRRVAVKCLPLDTAEGASAAVEEALQEARASSFLTHPNIVTLHDFEVDDEFAYLVMEYVDGVTLAGLLARVEGGVLIYDEVAHVLRSVASALAYAHENGVLHLDIKPANVLIDRSGAVKLGDFGMATLASAAGWGGARGGTVGYMPPEQLTGDLVDERTDVYSLAVVCYEALTGTSPFLAPTADKSLKLEQKGAPSLSEKEPELAGPVELAFMSALDPSPAGRMASAEEFAGEVLPSLGDPDEGRASIAALMGAGDGAEDDFDESEWRALDPPGRRVPWVAGAACRAACALACGLLSARLTGSLGLGSWPVRAVCALVAGGLGALLPVAGAAATLALYVLALLAAGPSPALVLAAVPVVLFGALWCGRASGESPLSAAALLGAPALGAPAFTPGLAGYAMPPLPAAGTAALASLLAQMALACDLFRGQAVPAGDVSGAFLNLLGNAGTWALVAASAVSAALCSYMADKGSAPWCQAGQIATFFLLECGLSLKAGLENGGIWSWPPLGATAVALGSTVLMTVIVALFGPSESRREGDVS